MATWGDIVDRVNTALDHGDLDGARELVRSMQRAAAHSGELGQEASALFYEGLVADAAGELELAASCFAHLVDVDRRLHGALAGPVADALNSLAIVRQRLGERAAAADASWEAAQIYEELASPHRAVALVTAGEDLAAAERDDEAKHAFQRSLAHPAPKDAPWHQGALVGLYGIAARRKEFPEAMHHITRASRLARPRAPAFDEMQARTLCNLGHMGWVFGMHGLCALAYRGSAELTRSADLRAEALRGLERVETISGPLDTFRVGALDKTRREAYVLHQHLGFFTVQDVEGLTLGEIVEIDASRHPTTLA